VLSLTPGSLIANSLIALSGANACLELEGVNLYSNSTTNGTLYINQDATAVGNPVASFDAVNNTVELGKPLFAGDIYLNNPVIVSASASRPSTSGITLTPSSPTAGTISQVAAAGGVLSIGSSVANPAGLVVTDQVQGGIQNHVEVTGVSPQAPLLIAGGQSTNDCYIFPNVATNGILAIGSNNSFNQDSITVTDTALLLNKLGGAPQVLLATVTSVASGYTVTIPTPTGEGLYSIMVCSTPTSNQASRDAQLMTMAYVNAAGRIQMGGNGSTTTLGGGILDIYPLDATASMFIQYTGTGQGLLNISVVAFKISGPISGTF
jgi:hypothetical protein